MKNYYEILGVAPDCSQDEIKKAYRKLARTYHPDTCGSSDTTHFRVIQEAYENIGDVSKRAAYDRQLEAEKSAARPERRPPAPSWDAPFDTTWVFENYFDLLWHRSMTEFRDMPFGVTEGYDVDLILTAEEARTGGTVPIEIPVQFACPNCRGRGWTIWFVCDNCQGTGYITRDVVLNLKFCAQLMDQSVHQIHIPGYGTLKIRVIIR